MTMATVSGGYSAKKYTSASDGIGTMSSSAWMTHQTSPASHEPMPAATSSQAIRFSRATIARQRTSTTAQPMIPL